MPPERVLKAKPSGLSLARYQSQRHMATIARTKPESVDRPGSRSAWKWKCTPSELGLSLWASVRRCRVLRLSGKPLGHSFEPLGRLLAQSPVRHKAELRCLDLHDRRALRRSNNPGYYEIVRIEDELEV